MILWLRQQTTVGTFHHFPTRVAEFRRAMRELRGVSWDGILKQ
jgi:hypothetical protein